MTWYLTVLSADGQLWEAEALETKLKMSRGTLLPLAVLAPLSLAAADSPAKKSLPPSCQRQHLEEQKCAVGRRSCSQYTIERWRRRCLRDNRS